MAGSRAPCSALAPRAPGLGTLPGLWTLHNASYVFQDLVSRSNCTARTTRRGNLVDIGDHYAMTSRPTSDSLLARDGQFRQIPSLQAR